MTNRPGKKPLIHTARPDHRGSLAERLERLEASSQEIRTNLPAWITTGMLETGKKLYQELYSDLAQEHARVFDVQEMTVAFLLEQMDARLRLMEEAAGLASPALGSIRDTLNAIGEYLGEVAAGNAAPWADLTAAERQDAMAMVLARASAPQ